MITSTADNMPEAVDRANELSRLASKAKVALNAQKARAGRIAKMHKSLSKNLFQAKKMMKSKNDPLLVSLNDGVETARILMEEEKALVGKFETEYDACEQEAKDAIDEAVSYGKVMSDFWSGDKFFVVATTVLEIHRSCPQDDRLESSSYRPKSPSYDPCSPPS